MNTIMIVEDDETIREELYVILENNGYQVLLQTDFQNVAENVREKGPDLLLLDVNLPDKDGFHICMEIRRFSSIPIVFVTSRNTDMDELKSITIGGDDFITKPYNVTLLLAKINRILRKSSNRQEQTKILHKGAELDIEAGTITADTRQVALTRNELKIVTYLFRNAGKISQREDIIDYLWDNELFIDDNTLSVNITRIRAKLQSIGLENFIQTKHGQGYLI